MKVMDTEALLVEELMSVALIVGQPSESAHSADLKMRYADVRHLPILDRKHDLVGIVSHEDVLRARCSRRKGRPLVKDIMSRRLRTVREGSSAKDAADVMLRHKIGALPVVGADGRLLGILTETDFLRVFRRG
jgi:CBS domain-containing protein